MAAYAWSMGPAFAVVVPVHCARTASGMAASPQSRSPLQPAVVSAPGRVCPAAASRDWSRRLHLRACIGLLHHQRVEITLPQTISTEPRHSEGILSRAQRAHSRLSWEARLARNARAPTTDRPSIKQIARPGNLRHVPRSADSVRWLWLPQRAFFSDGLTSPSDA
jgi:hypothetical protein